MNKEKVYRVLDEIYERTAEGKIEPYKSGEIIGENPGEVPGEVLLEANGDHSGLAQWAKEHRKILAIASTVPIAGVIIGFIGREIYLRHLKKKK